MSKGYFLKNPYFYVARTTFSLTPFGAPTADVSFEALNEPFFDRLDMFSNVIDPITTLVALIFAPGGVKVECRGSEKMSDLS